MFEFTNTPMFKTIFNSDATLRAGQVINPTLFESVCNTIEGITAIGGKRLEVLWQTAQWARTLPEGCAAEVGAYRGGSARLIARVIDPAPMLVFDTFTGIPAVDPTIDEPLEGMFNKTSLEEVTEFLKDLENVKIYPGLFPQTARMEEKFKFVHVDVDIYQPALDCCLFFWPRMVPGGVMVFDDYQFDKCPGIEKALKRFFGPEQIIQPYGKHLGQCFIIKGL